MCGCLVRWGLDSDPEMRQYATGITSKRLSFLKFNNSQLETAPSRKAYFDTVHFATLDPTSPVVDMAPALEPVFTMRAFLSKEDTLAIGPIHGGSHRMVAPVASGFIEGPGIRMEFTPGSCDWPRLDATTGILHLDVRSQARNKETGDCLFVTYTGMMKLDPMAQKVMEWSPEAKTTKSSEHYFFTTPKFEVSSQEMKWMEQTVFVAHGHFVVPGDGTQAVEYEVYKVCSA
ncbi:hypothetical protein LTR22_023052 [Elasticomyces elasticus]|nr:hypothetical protein LTR22_023052 [Elasticomyces elasticus]KAK4922059.1 hypothetical protein LTR49_010645 [Elasticomyces elasticus]KAK5747789.1 hypothetical protein LTS12_022144 [Elasticomyces elasticus]